MLNIATPELTPGEWQGVRAALGTVQSVPCGEPAPPGTLRAHVSRVVHALVGQETGRSTLTPEQRAIRAFLCDSARGRRIAEDHVPALGAYGFTRAQIEAMALIAA